jgi:phosphoribosylformimino-5-aminoimidazole carboxamide ribotide isomerase
MFEVIPAIDLLDGKAVRLAQGEFNAKTIYSNDPVEVAKKWESLGAHRIHVVDLNGARTGIAENLAIIKKILKAVKVPVQIGGGIRRADMMQDLFDSGADRVVLGTTAINNPNLISTVCPMFGDKIAVAIDVKNKKVATHGWRKTSLYDPIRLAKDAVVLGVRRFIYTDIKRDGMLTGPDIEGLTELARECKVPVIASGGITSKEDIEKLKALEEIGIEGCIIGRALYTGDLKLEEIV